MSTALLERPNSLISPYSRGCLNRCGECGAVCYGSEESCRRCGADDLDQLPQVGEIFSYTTVRQGVASFVLALVEFPGGQLVTAQIVDDGRNLRIGLPVELVHGKTSDSCSGGLFFSPLPNHYVTK